MLEAFDALALAIGPLGTTRPIQTAIFGSGCAMLLHRGTSFVVVALGTHTTILSLRLATLHLGTPFAARTGTHRWHAQQIPSCFFGTSFKFF